MRLAHLEVHGLIGGRGHGLPDPAGGIGAALVLVPAGGADDDLGPERTDQPDQVRFQGPVRPALLHVGEFGIVVVHKAAQEGGFGIAQGPEGRQGLPQGAGVPGLLDLK